MAAFVYICIQFGKVCSVDLTYRLSTDEVIVFILLRGLLHGDAGNVT